MVRSPFLLDPIANLLDVREIVDYIEILAEEERRKIRVVRSRLAQPGRGSKP
jgi:hypothetical protein